MGGGRLGSIANTMYILIKIASIEIGIAHLLRFGLLYNYFGWSEQLIAYPSPTDSSAEGRGDNKR